MNNTNTMKDKKIHTSDASIQLNKYNDRIADSYEKIAEYKGILKSLEVQKAHFEKKIQEENNNKFMVHDMIALLNQY